MMPPMLGRLKRTPGLETLRHAETKELQAKMCKDCEGMQMGLPLAG